MGLEYQQWQPRPLQILDWSLSLTDPRLLPCARADLREGYRGRERDGGRDEGFRLEDIDLVGRGGWRGARGDCDYRNGGERAGTPRKGRVNFRCIQRRGSRAGASGRLSHRCRTRGFETARGGAQRY